MKSKCRLTPLSPVYSGFPKFKSKGVEGDDWSLPDTENSTPSII